MGLLKFSLLISGLHIDPVCVIPKLVLLQAHLCGKYCLTVWAAVTQLLSYCGLMRRDGLGYVIYSYTQNECI